MRIKKKRILVAILFHSVHTLFNGFFYSHSKFSSFPQKKTESHPRSAAAVRALKFFRGREILTSVVVVEKMIEKYKI